MKKFVYLTSILFLCLVAGAALAEETVAAPAPNGGELVPLVFDAPAACRASAKPETGGAGGGADRAFCSADCGSAPDVSCSGSGVCNSADRACASGEPGHVTCNGVTTSCPACQCTEGARRFVSSSDCCCDYTIEWDPKSRRKLIEERCVNGFWVYAGFTCSGQNCPGLCPL